MRHFASPPTVADIARGLSTIPRWTGRTVLDRVGLRWSVLQHSLVCGAVASRAGEPVLVAYALLHDAEEILTGDIPVPYKTEQQVELGREVRREILAGLGLPKPHDGLWGQVKRIDAEVRVAEARVLINPREYAGWPPEILSMSPDLSITDEVWGLLDLDVRAGIELFTDTVSEILVDPRVKSLASRV